MVNTGRRKASRFRKTVGNPQYAAASIALLKLNEVIIIKSTGGDLSGRTTIFVCTGHKAHPLETMFQRPSVPLNRVTVSGPISIRQNDCGGACIT